MVHSTTSDPSLRTATERPKGGDADDLSVEPVASRPGEAPRTTALPPVARVEYLRRLVLEARVATLTWKLERARRRRAAVIEHYERVLDERDGPDGDEPIFSWLRRR